MYNTSGHLVISNDKVNDIVNEQCLCEQGKRMFVGFCNAGFTRLYIAWEAIIPAILHNSPVIATDKSKDHEFQ